MRFLWICLLFVAFPAIANDMPFDTWLEQFRKDALSQGISEATLAEALEGVAPDKDIIMLDRKQPEGSKTLPEYLDGAVTSKRIEDGRRLMAEHKALLKKIEKKYGVDKAVIVALWGIESNYGENTGNFSLVTSLATLAYDGRRSDFFREELMNALRIMQQEKIPADAMSGSWAGAMGQCQFMPTSFLKFAADGDADGKRDIWFSTADVFASIANYLSKEGWKRGGELSMPVVLPDGFDMALTDINISKATHEWSKLGVTYNDNSPLVSNHIQASVIMVGKNVDAVPYIVYDNYKIILKWNKSRYFATAVDLLAEEIR